MQSWPIILILACVLHWTTAVSFQHKSYVITTHRNFLKKVIVTDDTLNVDLSLFRINYIEKHAFKNLTNIESLDLSRNTLQTIESSIFHKLTKLKKLSLAHNKLGRVNNILTGLDNLEVLDLSHNEIFDVASSDFVGLAKSTEIIVEGNSLHQIIPSPRNSNKLKVPKKDRKGVIEALKNVYRRSAEDLHIKLCQSAHGIVQSIEEIGKDEPFGNCTRALKMLHARDDLLQLLLQDITGFKKAWYGKNLRYRGIDLSSNYISEITPILINELSSNVSHIDLSYNRIETIENNGLDAEHIRTMNLAHNLISKIEDDAFGKLNLTVLDISSNRLSSMAFAKRLPGSMKELYCGDNLISEIPIDSFRHLENLEFLVLKENKLREIKADSFAFLKNLHTLDLSFNNIQRVESKAFQVSETLWNLHLTDNEIEIIYKDTFNRHLNHLDLRSNKIENIEAGTFEKMNLRAVYLANNRITENTFSNHAFNGSVIKLLDLSRNSISRIDGTTFVGLTVGSKIKLKDNPLISIVKSGLDNIGKV